MHSGRILTLALFFLLSAAAAAHAQQGLSFLDGGKPLSGVPVSRFLDGGKSPVTTTGTDGTVTVTPDALGFPEGTEVAVWVRRCVDGTVTEVILARADESNPCPPGEGAAAGEACGCERIGTFVVGEGPRTFDVSRRSVLQNLQFGVGIDLYQWRNFEDVSGNQPGVLSHDASSTSTGFNGFLEYPCRRYPVAVGVDFGYTKLDVETRYAGGTQTGDVTFLSAGPYVRVGPQRGRILPYGLLSMDYTWNEGDFVYNGESETRDMSTWRPGFGAGLLYPIHPKILIRAEGKYGTTFDDNDADEHIRWKLALQYRAACFTREC